MTIVHLIVLSIMLRAQVPGQSQVQPALHRFSPHLQVQKRDFNFSPLEIHSKHWIYGLPQGTPLTNNLIIRDIYALSNNDKTKFADWVAYRLTPYEVLGTLDLERKWRAEPWLSKEVTLEPSRPDDYKGANAKPFEYDRGHQAPLAAFKGSRYASQANYFTNITPQKKELNQGPWRILEDRVRRIVKRGNTLWIMTGPIYKRDMPPLPNADESHVVPSGYWKIITGVWSGNELRTVGFVMDQNTPRNSPLRRHLKTVRHIERLTGLNFFWALPASIENGAETYNNKALIEMLLK